MSKIKEPPTVEEVRQEIRHFGASDYIVLSAILAGCGFVGLYCSFRDRKGAGAVREYLLAERNLSILPVAMSLLASCFPGVMLLGIPTEVYLHGVEFAFTFIPIILTGLVSSFLLLPVLYEMRLLSIYEYLERRFDKNVRFFGSLLFIMGQVFWLPVVVYLPALALNQVMGMNIQIVIIYICIICTLYACLGGLKAIVWTDSLQTFFLLASMVLVFVKGSTDVGGFEEVWQRNHDSGRLVIPFDGDITTHHTVWAITFGGFVMYLQQTTIDQKMLQKYLSLPSLTHARWALWIFLLTMIVVTLLCCCAGLVIYASYHECDPLATKLVKGKDQLLLVLVAKVFYDFPGLCGLFAAGIFGVSLSSFSSGLNSLSAVMLEDFLKPFLNHGLRVRATGLILRILVVVFGISFLVLALFVEKLDVVLQLFVSFGSITSGPVLGIFASGVFLPWVNAKGALFGGLFGLFASGFVIIGAQNATAMNKMSSFPKPTSVEGCFYYYNATVLASSLDTHTRAMFPLFKLSYFWYTALGSSMTIALALIVSVATGFTDLRKVDPLWFSPPIRSLLPLSRKLQSTEEILIRELKKNGV